MEIKTQKIAILIDGDNAQARLLKAILEEVSKYGKVTIRRIYGDWTSSAMNSWKGVLNELSFTPMQKFSYTTGKNSTDSSLIIDAMDILHDGVVDGFCIVSSDSDYTGLAKRIREEGIFVMGVGEKKTPSAFVQSCEIFTFYETIDTARTIKPEKAQLSSKAATRSKENIPVKIDNAIIHKAYEMSLNDTDSAFISTMGTNLRKLDPSFDSRTYGFKTLTFLLKSLYDYEVTSGKGQHAVVRRKGL